MSAETVKRSRPYDSSGRRRRAAEIRARIVSAATTCFLRDGYAGTTMARVAADAGVSVESLYKAFGNKPGLARAVWQQALHGQGATRAEERSDTLASTERDPRAVIRHWARLSAEVGALAAPLLSVLRAAALVDPGAGTVLDEIEEARAQRMLHNAAYLANGGHLRPGVSTAMARDVMLVYSVALYEPLVVRAGWSHRDYASLIERGLCAALLT